MKKMLFGLLFLILVAFTPQTASAATVNFSNGQLFFNFNFPFPFPSIKPIPFPTFTPMPSKTPSPTKTPTPTKTPNPTPTATPTPTASPSATPTPAPTFNETYYILPIIDNPATPDKINSIFSSLTHGGKYVKTGFAGVYRYMQQVDPNNDYKIKTDDLQTQFNAAVATNSPFIINLDGGQWAGGGPLINFLMSDTNKVMWDQNNKPWQTLEDGSYHLSWSKYNTVYRDYRKRNLQDTVKFIMNFKNSPNGTLLLGVSLDSEISMGEVTYFDYNPMMLKEWDEKYPGVVAPRVNTDPLWGQWTDFKRGIIDRTVQETADWVVQAGFPSQLVYPHQIPNVRPDVFCSTIDSGIANGIGGITTYAEQASNTSLFGYLHANTTDWGIFEYNPLSSDYTVNFNAVKSTWDNKAHFVTPYIWASNNPTFDAPYIIQGRPFEKALQDFINQYQNTKR